MTNFSKTFLTRYGWHVLLILILAVYYILKWEHITLPFFWDEAVVYAPAIKLMAKAGPTLLPGAIPVEYSRGHPLLLHFVAGSWITLFGDSNIALHSFGFFICSLLCIVLYLISWEIYPNSIAGIITILFFLLQEIIFVQSVMITPEFLVTLGICIWILGLLKENLSLKTIGLTIGLLTKESFLPLWFCAFIIDFSLNNPIKNGLKTLWKSYIPYLISGISIVAFFMIQFKIYGWFFFPLHINILETREWFLFFNIDLIYQLFLKEQNRHLVWILILISIPLLFMKKKWMALTLFFTVLFFIYPVHFDGKYVFEYKYLIYLLVHMIILFFYLKKVKNLGKSELLFLTIWIMSFAYIAFSTVNFFTHRYMIVIFSFMSIYVCLFISFLKSRFYLMTTSILISSLLFIQYYLNIGRVDDMVSDWRISMIDVMKAQLWFAHKAEDMKLYDKNIFLPHLNHSSLIEHESGYRRTLVPFNHLNGNYQPNIHDYILFTTIEPNSEKDTILSNENYALIDSFITPQFRYELFKRNEIQEQ